MKELIIDVVDDVKNIYLLEDDVLVEKYIESSIINCIINIF